MIAAIGYLGILVALVSAGALAVQGWRAARSDDPDASTVRLPVTGLALGALVAFVALELAILSHDFTIAYVAENTALATPIIFLLASGWAALEGSIVLWGIVLAGFTWLVARKVGHGDGLGLGALAVLGGLAVFWFGLMATAANPFALCTEVVNGVCAATSWLPIGAAVAPADGLGPNPLLQNHILMAVHPPLLYFGYVGFSVPFAFAIAALARRDQGRTWLDRTHRWSLIAWVFLTAGIFLGGWWSYEVLGWGGYWAWDPVENAAFIPWLAATAFIHSAVVQRRRGTLQAWNFILVIATFTLTILGTFLTRSGVIASVHSFTQSPVGPILLVFLGVVTVGSLVLFASRAKLVASSPRLDSLSSREGFLLANNLLLTLFAFTVLFGTMYPLIVAAFSGAEVSVGRPFFDRVSIPIALLLLLTMGIGAVAPWRVAKKEILWERTRFGLAAGLVAGAGAVLLGVSSIGVVIVIVLAVFVVANVVTFYADRVRRKHSADVGWGAAAVRVVRGDAGYWGGQIAHIGIAVVAVAIATTSALAVRDSVDLSVGESAVVAGYCVEYVEPFQRVEPNRTVDGARIELFRADCATTVATLEPRVNSYPSQAIATPDIATGPIDDVYLNLAGRSGDSIVLDVLVFPFQWLLWAGGSIVVLGGVVALARRPRRRKRSSDAEHDGAADADPEATHV
jgi:cytochrome c-type biogenesis protein CcmF